MNKTDINKRNLNKILRWCKDYYGSSKFKNINTLEVCIDRDMTDAAGCYCSVSNKIFINPDLHTSFIGVIDTMIHEYTHFRQNINVMYFKYFKKYSFNYENHPYEITARTTAERDRRKCFHDVFHKTYKKY